jgi:hypothetical protein
MHRGKYQWRDSQSAEYSQGLLKNRQKPSAKHYLFSQRLEEKTKKASRDREVDSRYTLRRGQHCFSGELTQNDMSGTSERQ